MRATIRKPPPPNRRRPRDPEPPVALVKCRECKRLVDKVEWEREDGTVWCGRCEKLSKG